MAIPVLVFIKERFARELIVQELDSNNDMEVLFNTGDTDQLLDMIDRHTPRVVIFDANLDDSMNNIRAIIARRPDTVVVATGIAICERDILSCAQVGVRGYIHNDVSIHECADIIRLAMRNEVQSTRIAGLLNQYLHTQFCREERIKTERMDNIKLLKSPDFKQQIEAALLTLREKQVMQFVDRGLSNKEIARELEVEVSTVKNHMHNILKKFKVKRRMEAAACFRAMESAGFLRQTIHA